MLMAVFALIVAPLIVTLTHGPGAHANMTAMTAKHDLSHDHGPADSETGHTHKSGSFGGHNPTDHDHQLQALICQPASALRPLPDKAHGILSDVLRDLRPEGPKRPPRLV